MLGWDLSEIQDQIDGMEIYILDKSLKIIASTIKEEIGMDFSTYNNYSKMLRRTLEGDQFVSEGVNFSILEGEIKKFSYIPTPDHQYLIELGVPITAVYPELGSLNVLNLAKDLTHKYPLVEDIRVYKFNQKKQFVQELGEVGDKPSQYTDYEKNKEGHVKKALETNEVQTINASDDQGNTYVVKYMPYMLTDNDGKIAWWKSYVIEIIYNSQIILDEIGAQQKVFLRNMSLVTILYFGFSFMTIARIKGNRQIAYEDYLTKLPNRKKLEELAQLKIDESDKKQKKFAILFFDLDHFKNINDTYGHCFGDEVLKAVGARMKGALSKKDIIARLGGDEFAGLIAGISSVEEIAKIGEKMSEVFETGLAIGTQVLHIKPSLGISIYPDHGTSFEELLRKADHAMYEAKKEKLKYKIYQ